MLPKKGISGVPAHSKDAVVSPPTNQPPRTGAFREEALGGVPSRVSEGVGTPRAQGDVRRRGERTPGSEREATGRDSIFHIEVEKIKPNPYQPRHIFKEADLDELTASVREFGILQPLVVSKMTRDTPAGTTVEYELVAGERRLLAAKRAGLERVPAIVRAVDSRRTKLELALIENVQRSDLSPLEAARAYAKLQEEFGLTQREIALRVGKSREAVANALRLLQLSPEMLAALGDGRINETQARALLSVEDLTARTARFRDLLAGRTDARGPRVRTSSPHREPSPEDLHAARALEERFGAPVKVVREKKGGKIVISFYSDEEYEGLRARLLGDDW